MSVTRKRLLALLLASVALGASPSWAEVSIAPPASVGVSSTGLEALNKTFHGLVDEGRLAGVATLLARHGKVVHFDAYGVQDVNTKAPLHRDTIFRIASMTKPVTGVAMMILYEEGKWKLDDPVAKYVPEFANLKVKGPDGTLVAQDHPMTMRELMSHTAGFDVSAGYAPDVTNRDEPLQAMIDKLGKLPLATQPGTDWRYGPSVNIQGHIIEKLSGQPLDQFFEQRIFNPLKMADTGFSVPAAELPRVTSVHTYDAQKKLIATPSVNDPSVKPAFLSGSGGLLSTTEDYWRFSQMLLNGGELDGTRILKPETIKLMRQNVLKDGVLVDLYGPSQQGIGFGMDVAVVLDPAKATTPQGKDSFYWGGAFGTWFWIDPTNDLVFIGMIQNLNGSVPGRDTPEVRSISYPLVYDALTDVK
ncbi:MULTISPECIES: serine hydrolase domain-containing protein [Phenylobacterium]|uniref:CubicO group peptidase (Beta-lactamase class C family) n=1 Tax=Phenylobacterium koreense TaxID=266125 RepID=A0ABV2EL34_9CAUL